ncbi:MAG TPA: hypothetical protein VJQ48_13210 [Candidatus Binatia bacterium]|nr:hypothetical protein [Candidatus Binatia bacterium]
MYQTIKAMVDKLRIQFTHQSLRQAFYPLVGANGESGRHKIVPNRRTMDRTIIGVVVM